LKNGRESAEVRLNKFLMARSRDVRAKPAKPPSKYASHDSNVRLRTAGFFNRSKPPGCEPMKNPNFTPNFTQNN